MPKQDGSKICNAYKLENKILYCQLMKLGYSLRHIDGLVQGCSNSSALAMELPQSCTKPSICTENRTSLWCPLYHQWSLRRQFYYRRCPRPNHHACGVRLPACLPALSQRQYICIYYHSVPFCSLWQHFGEARYLRQNLIFRAILQGHFTPLAKNPQVIISFSPGHQYRPVVKATINSSALTSLDRHGVSNRR